MNKKRILGAAVGCAAIGCVAAAARRRGGQPTPTMWDKMRQCMEQMPEDFPPRVMYDNIEKIAADTEEILRLLRRQEQPGTGEQPNVGSS